MWPARRGSHEAPQTRLLRRPGARDRASSISALGITSRAENVQFIMSDYVIRPAAPDDLPALTDIYNYYIVHTPITFDLRTFTSDERQAWFDDHRASGRHRLLVATHARG